MIYQIIWRIWLNLYINSWSLFDDFSAGILKIPGNKLIPNGYINDNPKLIIVSLKRGIWVLAYIAQKHDK